MAEFVKGDRTNRNSARFGGETAWRQHRFDDKSTGVNARRRSADQAFAFALLDVEGDLEEERGSTNICACTGVKPVRDGVVREDGITLVYAGGKLLAAHCG
ncbi:MAG: hypothetical protein JST44_07115 [Cyanobacteria bacterium SZAS LIN-5]|nr:hypothetical protein [Cyanobacteria bacterium SZAS LIN-5]RTL41797.1 MAG: hypothetical protein EKK48_12830 [Candidatus Melainabacteria bacterium]